MKNYFLFTFMVMVGFNLSAGAQTELVRRPTPTPDLKSYYVAQPDATRVARVTPPPIAQEEMAFASQGYLHHAAVAAAAMQGPEQLHAAVTDAATFYLNAIEESHSLSIHLDAIAALTEMAANGYLSAQVKEHQQIHNSLLQKAKKSFNNAQNCKGLRCQVLGMYAVLYAVLQPAQNLEVLKNLLKADYDGEENTLTVAIYVFQAALALKGPQGVYETLIAFDKAQKENSWFYRPNANYDAKNYRVYIEAIDILSAVGEPAAFYLQQLAASNTSPSLAAQIHASEALAYLPLAPTIRQENQKRLESLYCRFTSDYNAYANPLYRSPAVPSISVGSTLMERLAYAYGGGRAPEFVVSSDSTRCLPVVPYGIPPKLKSDAFLKDHAVDLALVFVPIPGLGILKKAATVARVTVSQTAKQASKQMVLTAGKISFRAAGKRAGYSTLRALNFPRKEAMTQLYKWGAKPAGGYAPALSGRQILLTEKELQGMTLSRSALPAYPVQATKSMVRGMVLTPQDITHINQAGILVKNAGPQSVASMASINPRAAQKIGKVINTTNDPQAAVNYMYQHAMANKNIPTVYHLQDVPVGHIVKRTTDISPDHIKFIDAMLTVEGKPQWGRLTVNSSGQFVFEPYLVK